MLGLFKDISVFLSNHLSSISADDSGADKNILDQEDRVTIEESSHTDVEGKDVKVKEESRVNISVRDYLNSKYVEDNPLEGLNKILEQRSDGPFSGLLRVDVRSVRQAGVDVLEIVKEKMVQKGKMSPGDKFEVMPNGKLKIWTFGEQVKDHPKFPPCRKFPPRRNFGAL